MQTSSLKTPTRPQAVVLAGIRAAMVAKAERIAEREYQAAVKAGNKDARKKVRSRKRKRNGAGQEQEKE